MSKARNTSTIIFIIDRKIQTNVISVSNYCYFVRRENEGDQFKFVGTATEGISEGILSNW